MVSRRAGEVLLSSIAYGDAAGLPVETKSAATIKELYPSGLMALIAPESNPYYMGEWPVGTTSDDTQLSVVVAEALIASGGFDLTSMASGHVEAYEKTPRVANKDGLLVASGWGGSTTHSMDRLAQGISPTESGEPDGAGNGILMKMAPLVYWHATRDTSGRQRRADYDALTMMTHDSSVTRACTRLHGEVLRWTLLHPGASMADMRRMSLNTLSHEQDADPLRQIHRALTEPVDSFDGLIKRYAEGKGGFKYGFYAPETLAMVYDLFTVARGEFNAAVWYAANLGGDADSTASMVAVMANFWSNGEFKRPDDFDHTADYGRLAKLSHELARVATRL